MISMGVLRSAKSARPFRPFELVLTGGWSVSVTHADAIAWGDPAEPHTFVVVEPDAGWSLIDRAHVTEIRMKG